MKDKTSLLPNSAYLLKLTTHPAAWKNNSVSIFRGEYFSLRIHDEDVDQAADGIVDELPRGLAPWLQYGRRVSASPKSQYDDNNLTAASLDAASSEEESWTHWGYYVQAQQRRLNVIGTLSKC